MSNQKDAHHYAAIRHYFKPATPKKTGEAKLPEGVLILLEAGDKKAIVHKKFKCGKDGKFLRGDNGQLISKIVGWAS